MVDVHRRALDEDLVGLVAVHDVAAHGQVGRVDLQVEAGLDDALVLGLHRLGDGVEVLVGRVVVLVGLEEGDDARRRGVHEGAGHGLALGRVAQVLEVALQRLAVLVGDRAAADRAQVLRGVARGGEAVAEARVGVEVRRCRARDVAHLEAAQAVADEGRVADLAHLAIADDVDARVDLVLDAILDRRADDALVLLGVDLLALVLREDDVDHVLGARKAPHVSRQDATVLSHAGHHIRRSCKGP
jgi:hypothetical protein